MPRVINQPTGKGRTATKQAMTAPHKSSPEKLSLNDDRTEKAARLQSRQALHDMQMNQIKAAASPMRKMNNNSYEDNRGASASPRTPRSAAAAVALHRERGGKENRDPADSPGRLNVVSNSAVTPMKRVPILANFEEWMKMATDNKINATNSWNFALIDYFHDMSLLKEGDGVNFQKASCTLDGCVKIYTSRVDSVASETGKLLSGLADSGGGKKKGREKEGEGAEGASGDEDEEEGEGEGDDGARKKSKKKKTQRSHEQTLAPSFASLQLKKLELEFAVDPLFKKASADFDQGGAKGLLLNHLSIDSEGRIVFDSSDDMTDTKSYPNSTQMQQTLVDPMTDLPQDLSNLSLLPDNKSQDQMIDLASLASKFFPDLSILDSQDICPSMKSFTLGDPTCDLDLPFLKAPQDWRETHKPVDTDKPLIDIPVGDRSGIFLDSENAAGFDDDDDLDGGPLGGFDVGPDVGFGEGGEAWAKDAALEPMLRVVRADDNDASSGREGADGVVIGDFDPANPDSDAYTVGLNHPFRTATGDSDPTENILSYFDAALNSTKASSWAGPEHWRIRKIKAAQAGTSSSDAQPTLPRARKEKEPFEVDFLKPMDQTLAEMLYTPAASQSAICLPKAQWKTKGRNLLPDDRHFSSRALLQLWLKPKARIGRRKPVVSGFGERRLNANDETEEAGEHVQMDEAYWARRREEEEQRRQEEELNNDTGRKGDYDANFFADDDDDAALPFGGGLPDDDDDDEHGLPAFTDAREMLSPPPSSQGDQPPPATAPSMNNNTHLPAADPLSSSSHLLPTSFGSQLVTQAGASQRLRPEYVNYARVAKKVDVRRLKENMWSGMSARLGRLAPEEMGTKAPPTVDCDVNMDMDMDVDAAAAAAAAAAAREGKCEDGYGSAGKGLKFTHLMRDLTGRYPPQQMRDISTSYCFIVLLHLANEKGLVLEGDYPCDRGVGREGGMDVRGASGQMREITVRRDESVGVGYVGE